MATVSLPASLLGMARELFVASCQLPLGALVGAAAERFCRCHARMPSVAVKLAVAHWTTSLALTIAIPGNDSPLTWSDVDDSSDKIGWTALLSMFARISCLAFGIVVGKALQPVGLTGGIATGKSTVSGLLRSPGGNEDDGIECVVIDVDGIAHDILLPGKLGKDSVYDRLVSEFGAGILTDEKGEGRGGNKADAKHPPEIDRRKLGDIVFRDRQKRRKLNSITHPKIIKIMLKRILLEGLNLRGFPWRSTRGKRRVVCADIPLLFEGGLPMRALFGTVVVVACNPELQLDRLAKRNPDLTEEQCKQRIASQIPVEDKARRAHVVIRNDGSLASLKEDVGRAREEVADLVAGSGRGVGLHWLVVGFGLLVASRIATVV